MEADASRQTRRRRLKIANPSSEWHVADMPTLIVLVPAFFLLCVFLSASNYYGSNLRGKSIDRWVIKTGEFRTCAALCAVNTLLFWAAFSTETAAPILAATVLIAIVEQWLLITAFKRVRRERWRE